MATTREVVGDGRRAADRRGAAGERDRGPRRAPSAPKARCRSAARAEGYAVDDVHGFFYTNLADKNATVAIDVWTRGVASTWSPRCTGDGPRGLAVDAARRWLFVACTDDLVVLDAGGDGRVLDRAEAGEGVDNIDYVPSRRLVYVAAAKA